MPGVVGVTIATAMLTLCQVPPAVPSERLIVVPLHNSEVPLPSAIGAGNASTVIVVSVTQPPAKPPGMVYMISEVPGVTPVTTPLVLPMVTDPVRSVLLQIPPVDASESVSVDPWHTLYGGDWINCGNGSTITVEVVKQPDGSVYVIVVVPGAWA